MKKFFTSYLLSPNSYLLLGYYGFGNLGDELLLRACIKILNERGIENEKIIVLSNNPEETRKNFNVKAVNRWKIFEVIKALRKSEFLMLGGGGLFQDSTSIKSCVYYWAVVRLAKLLGVKISALGQSIGPLNSKIAKILTSNAFKACEKVHVRDKNSFNIAKNFGCKNLILGSDLVMTLKNTSCLLPPASCLLINLRPCENLESFIKIIAPHVKNFDGKKIGAALSEDDEKILFANKKILGINEIKLIKSFNEAENVWAFASCCVGMRLHFGVLSRIFQRPVALIPYDVKVKEFAEQSNIPVIINEWREPSMPLKISDCDTICP